VIQAAASLKIEGEMEVPSGVRPVTIKICARSAYRIGDDQSAQMIVPIPALQPKCIGSTRGVPC
jgi:hypothetical protein